MNKNRTTGLIFLVLALARLATGLSATETDPAKPKGPADKGNDSGVVGEEVAIVTQAPRVPPPIQRTHAISGKEVDAVSLGRQAATGSEPEKKVASLRAQMNAI